MFFLPIWATRRRQTTPNLDLRTGVGEDYTGQRETHGALSTRRQAAGVSQPLIGDRTMPS
jgi:hypothetical protein